ncbi:vitamin K epoxide reductase family protein [Nafulsella turpanensis]|uniref:vitamin K epoxide reductase family protein n=1 Tax=Nafulsella turpanensis TaxID=1265690 RepID=UPI00036987AF|nr:vitamin K epoxide reductase family protein [Nafulsella turpanensis]
MGLTFGNLFFVKKEMFSPEKQAAHEEHHRGISWVYYAIMVLGLWLLANPLTFYYEQTVMTWNDILSGLLLIGLSYFALKPYNLWAQWGLVFLGVWLFVAPMVFHVRDGTALLVDYFVATLTVGFAIVVARQPGIKLFAQPGPGIPPGWSYNPSSWGQRAPVIFLAWLGFFIARYMGAFQLEIIHTVWDPFFGDGTKQVLTSKVSKSFPVSDAMLGAFSYILDVLFGYAGGVHRWRTMPWVVIIFAIMIVPLGVVSITLIILQPVSVGYWCFLCLCSATISLIMIPFTVDEVVATIQMIKEERKKGKSFWELFWFGGTMEGGKMEEKEDPKLLLGNTIRAMGKDLLIRPWNLCLIAIIGIWIMSSPGLLGFKGTMADNNHVAGALIVTFAVISMSEVARIVRYIFILFGIWLIAAPFIFGTEQSMVMWATIISGVLLIPLSFPRGKVEDKRGSYDKYIK